MANKRRCEETLSKLQANKGLLCYVDQNGAIPCYLHFYHRHFFYDKLTQIFMLYEDLGNMKNDSLGLNVLRVSDCLRDGN